MHSLLIGFWKLIRRKGLSKNKPTCENAVAQTLYGSCALRVMGSCLLSLSAPDSLPVMGTYIILKTGIELHWLGPGTKFKKRLARGDPGIKRLDKIAKQHDIDYARAKNLQDKWKADTKMIAAIYKLPGKKIMTKRIVCEINKAKYIWNCNLSLFSQ